VPSDPIGNTGEPLELTALILNPESDYDQDGTSTADEEIAGTDANNRQSVFIINLFAAATSKIFNLSWTTVSGKSYTVESTPQLSEATWTPVDSLINIPGTGAIISVEFPHGGDSAFFRVRVE